MSVDPNRVREIFDAAARLPKEQQAAYLATACGESAALRSEVESLLERANSSTTQLSDDRPPPSPMIGIQVGQYTIKRVIGSGGMGVVYQACRSLPAAP